jgi:hypothetical protein
VRLQVATPETQVQRAIQLACFLITTAGAMQVMEEREVMEARKLLRAGAGYRECFIMVADRPTRTTRVVGAVGRAPEAGMGRVPVPGSEGAVEEALEHQIRGAPHITNPVAQEVMWEAVQVVLEPAAGAMVLPVGMHFPVLQEGERVEAAHLGLTVFILIPERQPLAEGEGVLELIPYTTITPAIPVMRAIPEQTDRRIAFL